MPKADLGREVNQLCRRVLGDPAVAHAAANAALAPGVLDHTKGLARAVRECRRRADAAARADRGAAAGEPQEDTSLTARVATELAAANAALPDRQREALALRELLELPHSEIGAVLALDAPAVATLMARSRLAFRAQLRRTTEDLNGSCADAPRALRLLAARQDGEGISPSDGDWIDEHLGQCRDCERAHAAMLEASVCYRAWDER